MVIPSGQNGERIILNGDRFYLFVKKACILYLDTYQINKYQIQMEFSFFNRFKGEKIYIF